MTVGLGLTQMAVQNNNQGLIDGSVLFNVFKRLFDTRHRSMALCGVGVGLTAGPFVIQARFVKPNHVAIVNAMLLFVSVAVSKETYGLC